MLNKERTSLTTPQPRLLFLPIQVLTTTAPKPMDPTHACLRTEDAKRPQEITGARPRRVDGNELAQSW